MGCGGFLEVPAEGSAQQLVGATQYTLPPDVLPGGRGQPTPDGLVLSEPGVEPLLRGPVPDGVVDCRDHHRGGGMGVQHSHGTASLQHQCLVLTETPQGIGDLTVSVPILNCFANGGVDNKFLRPLPHLQHILQQAKQSLSPPAAATQLGPSTGRDAHVAASPSVSLRVLLPHPT